MTDIPSVQVWTIIIREPGSTTPVVIDNVASQAAGIAFIIAYKNAMGTTSRITLLPVDKRAFPTMGVSS